MNLTYINNIINNKLFKPIIVKYGVLLFFTLIQLIDLPIGMNKPPIWLVVWILTISLSYDLLITSFYIYKTNKVNLKKHITNTIIVESIILLTFSIGFYIMIIRIADYNQIITIIILYFSTLVWIIIMLGWDYIPLKQHTKDYILKKWCLFSQLILLLMISLVETQTGSYLLIELILRPTNYVYLTMFYISSVIIITIYFIKSNLLFRRVSGLLSIINIFLVGSLFLNIQRSYWGSLTMTLAFGTSLAAIIPQMIWGLINKND